MPRLVRGIHVALAVARRNLLSMIAPTNRNTTVVTDSTNVARK
jgi:hypothetical protein